MGTGVLKIRSGGAFVNLLNSGGGGAGTSSGGKFAADGRLTLESGVGVSSADQSAKTTLYYTPYVGEQIGLYDGSSTWDAITFAELSLSLAGYTADKNYDIFCYSNGGIATLESLVWTDATTRATALVYQNGVLVKTGATTRRYLGTIRINATGGQCEDAVTQRYVWNMYNRESRNFYKYINSVHTYNSTTIRPWNNDATNKVEFVCGQYSDIMLAFNGTLKAGSAASNCYCSISTDQAAAWTVDFHFGTPTNYNSQYIGGGSPGVEGMAAGYHYFTACESGATSAGSYVWFTITGNSFM